MPPLVVAAHTASCAAGVGMAALSDALRGNTSGLQALQAAAPPAWAGAATVPEAWAGALDTFVAEPLPAALAAWDCRPTRLAFQALQQDGFMAAVAAARERWGAARVGLVLGTSASTIGDSEAAYRLLDADGGFPAGRRNPRLNTPHALAAFVQQALGLQGPAVTVSTACSSSAKACGSARRWLQAGVVEAVVVAGVEALSASLLFGFRSLGLVAPAPCQPFGAARQGISLGEAAAFVLLQRHETATSSDALCLLGDGEANDAHHMSAPHPQGLGAELALDAALARAGLPAEAIDFLNLHGTATPANDAVEAALVARRYAPTVHACATKGLTGHTMGAAGLLEAVVCLIALQHSVRAGTAHTPAADPVFGALFEQQLRLQPATAAVRFAASHSFGFGGNNAVLVFGRAGEARA
ncbi:beta-ketoacyl-[acyl-carrier-protein] synthase II [Rubrivivax rivuli]|uniref:Beta-ketoacyl-[acyl-carrier-protein] synthase II n=2 Tax=Rubrivivax rivuli TaxID=1862385 RepID=A0A437RIQ9_9BURK|nr:beta-ketoacyl-[acyl-carrier-protein] synthase II [Rubrivivax rivuli]